MSRTLKLILAINLMVLALLTFAYAHLMVGPGKLIPGHKDLEADCFACHVKATPKVAQDWYESKHGVVLVKCFVCHGQPDGKGSVPYAVNPDVDTTCRKCHDTSILEMERKYGLPLKCVECHPFHQNSLHHKAYVKPTSKKTLD